MKNSDRNFSGGYGFVVVPDEKTINKCYALAKEKFPSGWEYVLSYNRLPHVTLYHSKLKDVPREFAFELREKLSSSLSGLTFNLSSLECFGRKFIFWNIEPTGSSYDVLLESHKEALSLAKYIDRTASSRSEEEGLSLTEQENENVELFNHPLVRDLYMPHITLAFGEKASEFTGVGETENFSMIIDRVEFAEIGYPGIVLDVVNLDN